MTLSVQWALSLPTLSVEVVEIKAFGAAESRREQCNVVKFSVIARDGCTIEMSALVVPHICDAIYSQAPEDIAKQYSHLKDLDLADDGQCRAPATVELLVGSDFYWSLVSGHVQRGDTGPVALETKIVWVLSGPVERQQTEESVVNLVKTHTLFIDTSLKESGNLEEGLEQFWELEAIGVKPKEESVHTKFTQEITFQDGRYEVSLPWRFGCQGPLRIMTFVSEDFMGCTRDCSRTQSF